MPITYPVTLTDVQKDLIDPALPVRREGSVTLYLPITFNAQTAVFVEVQSHEGLGSDGSLFLDGEDCPKVPDITHPDWVNEILELNDTVVLGKVLIKKLVFEILQANHEVAPSTEVVVPVRILVPATNFVKFTAKGSAGDVGAEIGQPRIILGHGVQ